MAIAVTGILWNRRTSGCISRTSVSQIDHSVRSVMAKGPPRQRRSSKTNSANAAMPAIATAAARTRVRSLGTNPPIARPIPPTMTAAAVLIAIASHAVWAQCPASTLTTKAVNVLTATETP